MPPRPKPSSELYRLIWAVAARVPRGRVATYGQLAALAGRPGQPRLAGYALHHLPEDSNVPWHRVINASGRISARSGIFPGSEESLQMVLLRKEGIRFDTMGRIDLARYQWRPRNIDPPSRSRRRKGHKEGRIGS